MYGLGVLVATSILLALTGTLQFSAMGMILGATLLLAACFVSNLLFARLYGAAANSESAVITALILFFLFSPPQTLAQALIITVTGVLAMASKYLIAWHKRHIFNPAAIAALAAGWLDLANATWWVATDAMTVFVLILGVLIVRKLHRFRLLVAFMASAVLALLLTYKGEGITLLGTFDDIFTSFPLLFLGMIMLTEPLTMPPTRRLQIAYGAFVGALIGLRPHLGSIFMTPELGLILGNLAFYGTTLRGRVTLNLLSKQELAPNIYEFNFKPDFPFKYRAGQYMDVTLPQGKTDIRGNRRSFTIASSPTEGEAKFGIKFNTPSSSFKSALLDMPVGGEMYGAHLSGDFMLGNDFGQKLAFIAGGIGITPFRSMLKYLIDTKQTRDAVLFYQLADSSQLVYQDILEAAKNHGLQTIMVLPPGSVPLAGWENETGYITKDMITRRLPDFIERRFYISGPPGMVQNYKSMLSSMGVRHSSIITDYFSGY